MPDVPIAPAPASSWWTRPAALVTALLIVIVGAFATMNVASAAEESGSDGTSRTVQQQKERDGTDCDEREPSENEQSSDTSV